MESDSVIRLQQSRPQAAVIEKAADTLADCLAETFEVRELIRLAADLRTDPDVHRIATGIRDIQAAEGENKQPVLERLLQQREALPVVQHYRRAERLVVRLFSACDVQVSQTAGMEFAENARANMDLLQYNTRPARHDWEDVGTDEWITLSEKLSSAAEALGAALAASPEMQNLAAVRADGEQGEQQIEMVKALFSRAAQRVNTTLGVRYTDFVK